MKLLRRSACDRLFTTVHRYSGHACEGEMVSTVLGRVHSPPPPHPRLMCEITRV